MNRQLALVVTDSSCVAAGRRLIDDVLSGQGENQIVIENAKIIVTEMATNLFKHANKGTLLIQKLFVGKVQYLECLAIDKGPGISDIALALSDGYTTTGSMGSGLGGMRRLANIFDIYSQPKQGTIVLARLEFEPKRRSKLCEFDYGIICQPVSTENHCGDNWAIDLTPERLMAIVVDGLGHGVMASEAANIAVDIFKKNVQSSGEEIIDLIHSALHSTRGAAVAISEIDLNRNLVRYTGIGNISSRIYNQSLFRNLISHNGIAGAEVRKIQTFTYPWNPQAILIMHSDGIATHWDFNNYPGLVSHNPATIGACLYRDYSRNRDDATILVIKQLGANHDATHS